MTLAHQEVPAPHALHQPTSGKSQLSVLRTVTLAHVLWARRIGANPRYQLTPAARHVLLTLASYASRTGAAWPSATVLADETGRHPETVREALAILADLRDPDSHAHLFADVDRQPGRSAIFQFPTPDPQSHTVGDLSRPPVEPPVKRLIAQLSRSAEVPPVSPEPPMDGFDPNRVRGYCPDCGHHWVQHQAGGCRYLCECRQPRP